MPQNIPEVFLMKIYNVIIKSIILAIYLTAMSLFPENEKRPIDITAKRSGDLL